jgi:L-asparaginase
MNPSAQTPAARPVTVLAAGGTIAMAARGAGAVPALDAAALVAAVPELAELSELRARTLLGAPGAHLTLDDALYVARIARAEAAMGRGVVVTHGTDTLEETALLCDLLLDAVAPVVLTGAIRPASAPGADGPANLLDAVAAAGAPATAGLGALVCFAGELHAARGVRKVASSLPHAFGSPRTGPIGLVAEGRVDLAARPVRPPALPVPARLDARVPIAATALGDDGEALRAVLGTAPDALVLVTLGGGHVNPRVLALAREAAARIPVAAAVRPERGLLLHETYGFEGAEGDLRAAGLLDAGTLAPAGARVALLAGLAAGAGRARLQELLAPAPR